MKFVLIPDSFKGTLSSEQICRVMKERIQKHLPGSDCLVIPVADGGEGSVDAFITALGGEKIYLPVKDPYFEEMEAYYGLIDNGETAVIEMAACAGLPLVEDRKNPKLTTTYGVGEMILDAAKRGVKKIIVGLGGSSTTDAGMGAAAAVGVRFFNSQGRAFVPTGGTMKDVWRIELASRDKALEGVEIVTMCDIDNPMYGEKGAAYVFGPQKGADKTMVEELDRGLIHAAEKIMEATGKDVSSIPGAGAAGAMGAGMIAFFDSRLQLGIETVLDTVDFDHIAADADYILTGEGKLDSQSLRGKVVIGIARRAKKMPGHVIAVVGGAEDADIDQAYEEGVGSIFTINRLPVDFSVSRNYAEENLKYAVDNLIRLIAHSEAQ